MRLNSVQLQQHEQHQKTTQRMLQSLRVLHMSQIELKEYLQDAYESNPLLEITEACDSMSIASDTRGGENGVLQRTGGDTIQQTFAEYLYEQLIFLPNMDEKQRMLCKYLILCLDSKGYLDASLDELAMRVGQSYEEMEGALFLLQELDPPGVGARSLEECLLLQARRDPNASELVYCLIKTGEWMTGRISIPDIAKRLESSEREIQTAIECIRSYHTSPSEGFSDGIDIQYTIPEAEILTEDGQIRIQLNRSFLPKLSINEQVQEMLENGSKQEQAYLKDCQNKAEEILHSVLERENTMRLLLEYVVGWQKMYFLKNDALLPLTMVQTAEAIGVHPSTISRAVKDKYILFRGRQIPLKDLFIAKTKDGTSAHAVKKRIQVYIEKENPCHPYVDEQLRELLQEDGIQVSRRAISKYREEMHIPAAHRRKKRGKNE
jgi:RNA polymerase sigma-54 factor